MAGPRRFHILLAAGKTKVTLIGFVWTLKGRIQPKGDPLLFYIGLAIWKKKNWQQ